MGIKCTKCGYVNLTTRLCIPDYTCPRCDNAAMNTFIHVDDEDIHAFKCPKHGFQDSTIEYTGELTEYQGKYCWLCMFDMMKTFKAIQDAPILKFVALPPNGTTNLHVYTIVYEAMRQNCPNLQEIVILQVDGQPILTYDLKENKLKCLVRFQAAGMDIKVEPPIPKEVKPPA